MFLRPLYNLAAFQKMKNVGGSLNLSLVRADIMDLRIEWLNATVISLK